jgi:LPXTG-site transpeptidase (sortase) family protein
VSHMFHRRTLALLACVLFAALFAPIVEANTEAGRPIRFRETGHTLAYSFRVFFDRNGGLPIFGLPISEVFIEDGRPVQYFERARLEWHAVFAQVQAGHLGRWAAQGYAEHPAFVSVASAGPEQIFFAPTGHTLGNPFAKFWQEHGGLNVFGYPISEPFEEVSSADGQMYLVQYFERARFEYHPELPPAYQVSLGHLGRQYLAAHPAPEWALSPVASANEAWNAVRPTRVHIPSVGVDTEIVEGGFSFGVWDVPRYTAIHYWPVAAVPGTAGNIVLAGHVGYRGIIFNKLPNTKVGDEVFVTVAGQDRRYIVQEVLTLLPQDTWVMQPTAEETLTLITCVPIGVYTHRLIVRAIPG